MYDGHRLIHFQLENYGCFINASPTNDKQLLIILLKLAQVHDILSRIGFLMFVVKKRFVMKTNVCKVCNEKKNKL